MILVYIIVFYAVGIFIVNGTFTFLDWLNILRNDGVITLPDQLSFLEQINTNEPTGLSNVLDSLNWIGWIVASVIAVFLVWAVIKNIKKRKKKTKRKTNKTLLAILIFGIIILSIAIFMLYNNYSFTTFGWITAIFFIVVTIVAAIVSTNTKKVG